jgi:hypothetical protein
MVKRHLLIGLCLAVAVSAVRAEELSGEKLDEALVRLGTHLKSIHDQSEASRTLSASLLVGTGALVGGAGYLLTENLVPRDQSQVRGTIYGLLALYSGVFILPGILIYTILPEAERLPNDFFGFAEGNESERRRKAIKGEIVLKTLSDNSYVGRMIGGLAMLAAGAGQLSYIYLDPSSPLGAAFAASSPGIQSLTYTGITFIGLGLASFLFKSKAETEQEAYAKWRAGGDAKKGILDLFGFDLGLDSRGAPALVVRASL